MASFWGGNFFPPLCAYGVAERTNGLVGSDIVDVVDEVGEVGVLDISSLPSAAFGVSKHLAAL
jgi:hypothetical protein